MDGEHSLVRYIKSQVDTDEVRSLAADNFLFVIMSEAQTAGVQQLFSPLNEVAMDLTHGTNAYQYQLTTLM